MISSEHQKEILKKLAIQANERRARMRALNNVNRQLAMTMTLAVKHKLTWHQIGLATSMHRNVAYKWWRRQPISVDNASDPVTAGS